MTNARFYTDTQEQLLLAATPGQGTITFEEGAVLNANEQSVVLWLLKHLGGDILILTKVNKDRIRTADLLWRNGLVDIKHVTGNLSSLDKSIQYAMRQTNQNGVIVDITLATFSNEEAISKAAQRLSRSRGNFVLLIRKEVLVAYLSR